MESLILGLKTPYLDDEWESLHVISSGRYCEYRCRSVVIREAGMKKRSKYILAGVVVLVCLILVFHCATTKTFRGRVVDADTKEPIAGAVVVASWYKESWVPLGETIVKLKDVKETLTDKNGQWSIRGPSGSGANSLFYGCAVGGIFYHTREPQFIIFKPGYCSWPNGFHIGSCKERLKPELTDDLIGGGTAELPKLTNREEKLSALPAPVSGEGALEKQREFIKLINEESKNLGLRGTYK
jgi:hypothetical protein